MGKSLAMKIASVLAVGIVLAHLSPLAMGMLLCIADDADPDCCSKPNASEPQADETVQLLEGSDCSCCIAIHAAPAAAGTTSHKAPVDVLPDSAASRSAVSSAATGVTRPGSDEPGNPLLGRLRTVVLLI